MVDEEGRSPAGSGGERNAELRQERRISTALATLAGVGVDKDDKGSRTSTPNLAGWLEVMRTTSEDTRLREQRVVAIGPSSTPIPWSALSVLCESLDVVLVRDDRTAARILCQRYVDGALMSSEGHIMVDPRLAASLVSHFVERGGDDQREPDVVAVFGGDYDHRLADTLIDILGAPFVLIHPDLAYSSARLRIENTASGCYLGSTAAVAKWGEQHPLPAEHLDLDAPRDLVRALESAAAAPSTQWGSAQRLDRRTHRTLLVSYFASPASPVSVQRLSYWHRFIPSIAAERGTDLDLWWLSATTAARDHERMIVVPDRGPLRLSATSWERYWDLQSHGIATLGAGWSEYVQREVSRWDVEFDTVIISGGPFHYFDLAGFFKRRWGSRILLDFRDPFARDSRFAYSVDQRTRLIELEDRLAADADAIVSVNEQCLRSIAPDVDVPRREIANGFDESTIDGIEPEMPDRTHSDAVVLVYAGTIFRNLPIDDLLDALPVNRYRLLHFGRDHSSSRAVKSHLVASAEGVLGYEELIRRMHGADAGIIMTSGEQTTQTTKLFDYIGCDLDVIIVTNGRLRTGSLHELTEDLDGIHWVRNDPSELREFFASYTPTRAKRSQRSRFSRRQQAERLLDLILEVEAQ